MLVVFHGIYQLSDFESILLKIMEYEAVIKLVRNF